MSDKIDTAKPEAKAAAGDSAKPEMREPTTIVLKKSKITVVFDADFSQGALTAAQRGSAKNPGLFVAYLANQIATFDGKRWTVGEIRENLRGKDYLQLTVALMKGIGGDDEDGEDGDPL